MLLIFNQTLNTNYKKNSNIHLLTLLSAQPFKNFILGLKSFLKIKRLNYLARMLHITHLTF